MRQKPIGRDHNTYGFSMWVAGGGFKGGITYGETDEFSHKAVKDIVTHQDWLTTLLYQFGIEEQSLTFKKGARELKLLDGSRGRLVREILA